MRKSLSRVLSLSLCLPIWAKGSHRAINNITRLAFAGFLFLTVSLACVG